MTATCWIRCSPCASRHRCNSSPVAEDRHRAPDDQRRIHCESRCRLDPTWEQCDLGMGQLAFINGNLWWRKVCFAMENQGNSSWSFFFDFYGFWPSTTEGFQRLSPQRQSVQVQVLSPEVLLRVGLGSEADLRMHGPVQPIILNHPHMPMA